ncbi:MAG: cell division protein FtsA [Nitrospiraceae bacterium]|nr:cell division protein FtsA [Nitrospiraceae bacterium]
MKKTAAITGLDVGTTKVCAVVAERTGSGVRVLGAGISPSSGIRKGTVVNMEAASDAIAKAVREAELSSGVRIASVTAGISGGHVTGFHSAGAIGIQGREIREEDRERAVEAAGTVYIPLDREVLHVLPTEFSLDGQEGILDPVGMSGVRLEAKVHIITAGAAPLRNLTKCCERAGLQVGATVFQPVASARAVLTDDEREAGVVLVDIGGGTTDIAFFRDGCLRNISVIGVGGNHLTNDIAVGLKVTIAEAERIKKTKGAAFESGADRDAGIEITLPDEQLASISRGDLISIMQPRCEEMIQLVQEEIAKFRGADGAACGVVLTGGASLLGGFRRLAASMLGLPARIGNPAGIGGRRSLVEGPPYATGIGLTMPEHYEEEHVDTYAAAMAGLAGKVKQRVSDFFRFSDLSHSYKKEGGTLCLKSRK